MVGPQAPALNLGRRTGPLPTHNLTDDRDLLP